MVKTTDTSWLNPREGEIEKRWNTFLNKKAAESVAANSNQYVEGREEDPEDDRALVDQIMAVGNKDSGVDAPDEREEYEDVLEEREGFETTEPEPIEPDEDDSSEAISMFSLFEQRNWKALTAYIKLHPRCAVAPLRCGTKGLSIATKGNLLLHETCRIDPPLAVVEALINANKQAVSSKGEKGYLPLHYACACSSAEVVEKLLEIYPDAAKVRNESDLMLPLHIACKWGFSAGVLGVLLSAYPEGSKVRDIYAMVPMDYASKLASDSTRQEAVVCLQKTLKSKPISGRTTLIEQSGKSFSDVREDLNTATVKLERMTAEFDHRERTFALMFGREQDKVQVLEEEKERLLKESNSLKTKAEQQSKRLEIIQKEHKMMTALQKTNAEKRALLQKKVSVLESAHGVKKDIIGRLEHEINVKSKQELEIALKFQEEEFASVLNEEQRGHAKLQRELDEAKLNHQLYTKALLQEHDSEIEKFEEVTRKFEVLERELREQIEYESVMRESVEMELCNNEAKYQQELKQEQERVAYLEGHVERVNELLEAEQKRFNELEGLLKEAIQNEDEQHEELNAAMDQKRIEYESLLQNEQEKVKKLEYAYDDARVQLKGELERIEEFEKRESALLRTFEAEQHKLREIEASKDEIQEQLDSELRKVADLETSKEKLHAEMRLALSNKQREYEAEKEKLKEVQETQNSMKQVIESLNRKISTMEEEKDANPIEAESKVKTLQAERDELKQALEQEKVKAEELDVAERRLSTLLEVESEKVRMLEEAAKTMTIADMSFEKPPEREFGDDPCPSEEEALHSVQALEEKIVYERTRIWKLHTEQAAMKLQRDALTNKVKSLENSLEEKEKSLGEEHNKFEALEQEHSETLELLQSEREIVMAMREEYESNKAILEQGKSKIESLKKSIGDGEKLVSDSDLVELKELEASVVGHERALDLKTVMEDLRAANKRIEVLESSHAEKSQLLDQEQKKVTEVQRSVKDQKTERQKIENLQKDVRSQEILLGFEKDRVREVEREISRLTSLLMSEKKKSAILADDNTRIGGELEKTKTRADILEQAHVKNKELLDRENNKIASLERARDQLQELLQFERTDGANSSKLSDLMSKITILEKELFKAMADLEDKEVKVHGLSEQLQSFGMIKSEIVRLSAESRKRDIMLGAVLQAISGDSKTMSKPSIQNVKMHMEDMKRILGLDLAGMDDQEIKKSLSKPMETNSEQHDQPVEISRSADV